MMLVLIPIVVSSIRGCNEKKLCYRFLALYICSRDFNGSFKWFGTIGLLSSSFRRGIHRCRVFCIVTGFLMRQTISYNDCLSEKNPASQAVMLTYKKMKKLWKITAISTFLIFSTSIMLYRPYIGDVIRQSIMLIFELFYLPMSGFQESFFNIPLWYISALCLLSPLLYYLLKTRQDLYCNIIAPMLSIFIYGWYWTTYQSIENWNIWNGYFLIGLLRILAGLNVGIICYSLSNYLKSVSLSQPKRCLLSVFENGGYILVLLFSYFCGYNYLDFIKIIILALSISITFSQCSGSFTKMNRSVFYQFGQYAFVLYSTHWFSRMTIPWLLPNASYFERLPFYIMMSMSIAFCIWCYSVRNNIVSRSKK